MGIDQRTRRVETKITLSKRDSFEDKDRQFMKWERRYRIEDCGYMKNREDIYNKKKNVKVMRREEIKQKMREILERKSAMEGIWRE